MICTSCQYEVFDRSHYQTEIHVINAKRKINGIPPIHTLPVSSPVSIIQEKAIKHHPVRKTTTTDECFFCDEFCTISLKDHINTHLPYSLPSETFQALKVKFDNCECIFCSRFFKDKGRLKIHHLQHINKNHNESLLLKSGKKIINKQHVFEKTQIRRPIENVHDKIVRVEVIRKRNVEKSMKVKNDLKVSLMLNYQKHFTEHWRQ